MKIREVLKEATKNLIQNGIDSAAIDAKVLLAFILKLNTSGLFMKYDDELQEEQEHSFEKLVAERRENRPVAYITGHQEFYSLELIVNENVLIPRPETELLVDESLKFLARKKDPRILDICTGSGNIPIAICHEIKKRGQTVASFAFDISPEALEVAELNKQKHQVNDLTFFQHDLFQSLTPLELNKKTQGNHSVGFDLITANPPYVPMEDKPSIALDVINYEPHIALFEEERGCRAIFKIIGEAVSLLKKGGLLLVEISSTEQSKYIEEWFQKSPWKERYSNPIFLKDYAGINRFLQLEKNC